MLAGEQKRGSIDSRYGFPFEVICIVVCIVRQTVTGELSFSDTDMFRLF